ncbi:MAG: FG-GAP repeat domain-containing protein, partial [Terriglobia bacterium]
MTTSRLCWLALVVVYLALVSCASQPPEAPAEPAPTASQQGQPAETSQPAQKVQNEALPKGVFDSLARKLPENLPALSFREVARQSGIVFVHSRGERSSLLPEDMGSGAAWGDYNNDGHPDLYLVNQPGPLASAGEQDTEAGSDKLYRNNGDGTFTEVTAEAGLGGNGFGMGAFWGDYDRDGCLDLYVTNYGKSALYHNNCDGTFRDVTEQAGVANNRWATSALWFDYDRDGRLDLYVCNYVDFDPARLPRDRTQLQYGINVPFTLNPVSFEPQPNRLYHNNGDGIFTDVAVEAGVADPQGRSLVVTFADFDLDAWPDLYIGNDISANSLFRNRGNGRFEDVSASSGTEEYRGTMGIGLGDFDADGDQDFFLTHWVAQANGLYQNLYLEFGPEAKNRLFFGDVADMEGLGSISMNDVSWGTGFFDFDNDGRLDLVVINGSTLENPGNRKLLQRQKSRLFWNQGTTGFYDIASVAAAPLQRP